MISNHNKSQKIYIAGHKGMVGSSIVRHLKKFGYKNLIYLSHKELDLTNQKKVNDFFKSEKIEQVYLAAAKVGGIYANNTFPADFIYQNLMIEANIINASFLNNVQRLIFLGSSCIYPKNANQPIHENELLNGHLEPTNEPYAIAKIAGLKLCESYNRQYGKSHGTDFRCIMPTNLYGPGDNYHPKNSHVIPALLRRFHEAKSKKLNEVIIWGTGSPKRDFLFVDDIARACIQVMNIDKTTFYKNVKMMCSHVNVGSSTEISIKQLAEVISEVVGFSGQIRFDTTKPDGTQNKLMDSSLIKYFGWRPKISLKKGIEITYIDYKNNNL